MMLKVARLSIFLFIFSISGQLVLANENLDSILVSRNNQLTDYYRFKDGMEKRTWINMVDLNKKALQVIETDNLILDNHLKLEMNRSGKISDKLENAKLEILLIKREIELNSIMLEEQRFLNTNLVIAASVSIILFLIVLILFIDRQIRYRSTRMELERFWSKSDDHPIPTQTSEENTKQRNKINSLIEQNKEIKEQLEEISNKKRDQESQLQKEISSRRNVEEEIKDLISQIKGLS